MPLIEYSGTNIPGTYLLTPGGWIAELAGGYVCKQFQQLGTTTTATLSNALFSVNIQGIKKM